MSARSEVSFPALDILALESAISVNSFLISVAVIGDGGEEKVGELEKSGGVVSPSWSDCGVESV